MTALLTPKFVFAIAGTLSFASAAHSQSWPQWR